MEENQAIDHVYASIFAGSEYQANCQAVFTNIAKNSKPYNEDVITAIYEVLTNNECLPASKFYALYLLVKATELKNQLFVNQLASSKNLLDNLFQTAQFDKDKPVGEKGKKFFTKTPNQEDSLTGANYLRLLLEAIKFWATTYGSPNKQDPGSMYHIIYTALSPNIKFPENQVYVNKSQVVNDDFHFKQEASSQAASSNDDEQKAFAQVIASIVSGADYRRGSRAVFESMSQNSPTYLQSLVNVLTKILDTKDYPPKARFYTLLLMVQLSETRNQNYLAQLAQKKELLNRLYKDAKVDADKDVKIRGQSLFPELVNTPDAIIGKNYLTLLLEAIQFWDSLSSALNNQQLNNLKTLYSSLSKTVLYPKENRYIGQKLDIEGSKGSKSLSRFEFLPKIIEESFETNEDVNSAGARASLAREHVNAAIASGEGFKKTYKLPISNQGRDYNNEFMKAIHEVLASTIHTPMNKFYALYLLAKTSEFGKEELINALAKYKDLLNKLFQDCQFDRSKSPEERGKNIFSKNANATDSLYGQCYLNLALECLYYWNERYGSDNKDATNYVFMVMYATLAKKNIQFPIPFVYFEKEVEPTVANIDKRLGSTSQTKPQETASKTVEAKTAGEKQEASTKPQEQPTKVQTSGKSEPAKEEAKREEYVPAKQPSANVEQKPTVTVSTVKPDKPEEKPLSQSTEKAETKPPVKEENISQKAPEQGKVAREEVREPEKKPVQQGLAQSQESPTKTRNLAAPPEETQSVIVEKRPVTVEPTKPKEPEVAQQQREKPVPVQETKPETKPEPKPQVQAESPTKVTVQGQEAEKQKPQEPIKQAPTQIEQKPPVRQEPPVEKEPIKKEPERPVAPVQQNKPEPMRKEPEQQPAPIQQSKPETQVPARQEPVRKEPEQPAVQVQQNKPEAQPPVRKEPEQIQVNKPETKPRAEEQKVETQAPAKQEPVRKELEQPTAPVQQNKPEPIRKEPERPVVQPVQQNKPESQVPARQEPSVEKEPLRKEPERPVAPVQQNKPEPVRKEPEQQPAPIQQSKPETQVPARQEPVRKEPEQPAVQVQQNKPEIQPPVRKEPEQVQISKPETKPRPEEVKPEPQQVKPQQVQPPVKEVSVESPTRPGMTQKTEQGLNPSPAKEDSGIKRPVAQKIEPVTPVNVTDVAGGLAAAMMGADKNKKPTAQKTETIGSPTIERPVEPQQRREEAPRKSEPVQQQEQKGQSRGEGLGQNQRGPQQSAVTKEPEQEMVRKPQPGERPRGVPTAKEEKELAQKPTVTSVTSPTKNPQAGGRDIEERKVEQPKSARPEPVGTNEMVSPGRRARGTDMVFKNARSPRGVQTTPPVSSEKPKTRPKIPVETLGLNELEETIDKTLTLDQALNFKMSSLNDESLLFEDDNLQVGFTSTLMPDSHSRRKLLKSVLYYNNKSSGILSNFTADFVKSQNIQHIAQPETLNSYLEPGRQVKQQVLSSIQKPPFDSGFVEGSYTLHDKHCKFTFPLPSLITKFMDFKQTTPQSIETRWLQKSDDVVVKSTKVTLNKNLVRSADDFHKYFEFLVDMRLSKEEANEGVERRDLGGVFELDFFDLEYLMKISLFESNKAVFQVAATRRDADVAQFVLDSLLFVFRA